MIEKLDVLLQVLLREAGIQFTKGEFEDFKKRLINNIWNKITNERMDEILMLENAVNATPITLPNGRVGEDYNVSVPFKIENIEDYTIEGLEELGLTFTKTEEGFSISGTAQPEDKKGGDFPLILRYTRKGAIEGEQPKVRKLNLILNPDPRTLWKDISTPRDIEYFKEDSQMEYVKVEAVNDESRKNIVAASQRGRSHAHEGKPRDDHFKLHYCKDTEWYIIAVADGAGSAKYSREGSRIACETVVKSCIESLSNDAEFEQAIRSYNENQDSNEALRTVRNQAYQIMGRAALKAFNEIKTEAERKQAKTKDYATTMLLAICKKFDFGWAIGSFWVGDGAMCVYNEQTHTAEMLGMPDEGEFAGQTRFLTMPEIFNDRESFYNRFRIKIYPDFSALMLMTDGVSDPKFETDANLQNIDKWDALWNDLKENGVELTDDNEKSQEQLLEWLNFWDRGNHDDRTIAILY